MATPVPPVYRACHRRGAMINARIIGGMNEGEGLRIRGKGRGKEETRGLRDLAEWMREFALDLGRVGVPGEGEGRGWVNNSVIMQINTQICAKFSPNP